MKHLLLSLVSYDRFLTPTRFCFHINFYFILRLLLRSFNWSYFGYLRGKENLQTTRHKTQWLLFYLN